MDDTRTTDDLILDALDAPVGDRDAYDALRDRGALDRFAEAERAEARIAALFAPDAIARAGATAHRRRFGPIARAASIAVVGGLLAGGILYSESREDPIRADLALRGFEVNPNPSVVCDTPEKFVDYTTLAFGEPITARFDSAVALVGWRATLSTYDPDEAGQPRTLLAYDADGDEVVVLFQPARFPRPELGDASGLTLFGGRFGGVEVWEVSDGDTPVVLPLLSLADAR
ncbi:MAG: hypothetical protein AAGH64_01615 [Planctomycetota bacterium]